MTVVSEATGTREASMESNMKAAIRQETAETMASSGSVEQGDPAGKAAEQGQEDARTDEELITEAVHFCKEDFTLTGLRHFRKVKDTNLLNDEHKEFICKGEHFEKLYGDLLDPPTHGWTKQGESHGSRDFITYYKVGSGGKLKCRIESVIEASLYLPLLAVLNETDLYETWFPKWTFPFKLKMSRSKKLKQSGRAEQVVQVTVDLPFPLYKREIIFWGFVDDGTSDKRRAGVKLLTVDESFEGGNLVPPPESGVTRMEVEGDFLFRPCPDDHEALRKSKAKYPKDEKKILAIFVVYCDPKIAFIPHAFMNFCTRTAMGTVWRMLLGIAEEVREGKRTAYSELIESKREVLYDWLEERASLISGYKFPKEEEHGE